MTSMRAFTLADFLAIPEQQPALEFNTNGSIQQKVGYYRGARPALGKAQDALSVADLVVEILSPSDDREQQREKCRWYLAQGACAALLPDPQTEIAEYFGPEGVWDAYLGAHRLPLDALLPGLQLSAESLFAVLHRR